MKADIIFTIFLLLAVSLLAFLLIGLFEGLRVEPSFEFEQEPGIYESKQLPKSKTWCEVNPGKCKG